MEQKYWIDNDTSARSFMLGKTEEEHHGVGQAAAKTLLFVDNCDRNAYLMLYLVSNK